MSWEPRILIVEKDLIVRTLLIAYLEDEGYLVDAAATTRDAQNLMHRHAYDMVFEASQKDQQLNRCGGPNSCHEAARHKDLSLELYDFRSRIH